MRSFKVAACSRDVHRASGTALRDLSSSVSSEILEAPVGRILVQELN